MLEVHIKEKPGTADIRTLCHGGHPFPILAKDLPQAEKASVKLEKPLCSQCRNLAKDRPPY